MSNLRLDRPQVQEIVHDGAHSRRLVGDSFGKCPRHGRVIDIGEGLGEHRQRADWGLQLVTHVGDKVTAHRLDAARLGHIADEADRADPSTVGHQRPSRHPEDLGGWPEELEFP